MALLELRNLGVTYRGQASPSLHDVSLELAQGERLAVLGESGSGKTSLALALGGLLPPAAKVSGEISWPGFERPPVLGKNLGFIFQDPAGSLDPLMRVGDQIGEVIGSQDGLARRSGQAVHDLLDAVRLPDPEKIARAYPHQLSGGQKQRVAIACAIALNPRLLIADEATSALDTIVQAAILKLLEGLVADRGASLLLITHDIAVAAQNADRIAVLHQGHLVEIGPAKQITRKPQSEYTQRLIAAHIGLDSRRLIEAEQL